MAILGSLTTPYEAPAPDGISEYLPNQFHLPPTSWGFFTDVDFGFAINGLSGVPPLFGALVPEGNYLEPTTGQIWPR